MKHAIYPITCLSIYAALVFAMTFTSKSSSLPAPPTPEIENTKHDWECNHIIHDHYHGYISEHYVDSYELMVNGGIKFISHDGKTYEIPYPYFTVEDNK